MLEDEKGGLLSIYKKLLSAIPFSLHFYSASALDFSTGCCPSRQHALAWVIHQLQFLPKITTCFSMGCSVDICSPLSMGCSRIPALVPRVPPPPSSVTLVFRPVTLVFPLLLLTPLVPSSFACAVFYPFLNTLPQSCQHLD